MFEIAIKSYFSEQILKIILYEVVTQKFMSVIQKTYLIWHNRVFYHSFYPSLPIFYTDVSDISVTFRNSGPAENDPYMPSGSDSPDSLDSPDSPDSPESQESPDSSDSPDSSESPESILDLSKGSSRQGDHWGVG